MGTIKNALLSVYDKGGLVELARGLHEEGIRLLSTGGTAAALTEAGLPVVQIAEYTGSPEMLDGRVKTLHPKVFGGILARRDDPAQMAELEEHGLWPIDLVIVNLYPFAATVGRPDHRLQDALEQIDIGGVTLLRAAAKNAPGVVVAVDPADYEGVLAAIRTGDLDLARRLRWAARAIAHTAGYEAAICNYLNRLPASAALGETPELEAVPAAMALTFERIQDLRYGENPHQTAAFFAEAASARRGIAAAEQLHGKELSFNNILDVDAAWRLARTLSAPGAVVIKHGNPCGAAIGGTLVDAYTLARATDPVSAFGGVIGLNQPVDAATAAEIVTTFVEAVVAPGFDDEALAALREKKNLRLLSVPGSEPTAEGFAARDLRRVDGGLLVQDRDAGAGIPEEEWECVTKRRPAEDEEAALRFAWTVVPHVKSNAIVLARGGQLIGVGAGQMSRVDSCRIAVMKAADASHDVKGSVAASDAFFPFPDGPESLAEAGVTAIVQPGGSVRDDEVIEAADRLGLAMILTKTRHFLH
jgi:phosphoribosylaminoimidazolecarboxamide formyltransferase/IMP cyclohydrolase